MRTRLSHHLVCLTLWFLFGVPIFHFASGDEFPALRNTDEDHDVEPMPASDAAKKLQVPKGFHVNVFASEPDVQNPIDMAWDGLGRLWIAENYTYAEKSQRFDLTFRDRVIILEDSNQDGVAESRTVFTNHVQMLTSVEVGHGGIWLMCPPQLLFIPDRDRDDKPDGPPQVVLDGFTVAKENYHNFANGLRWGPDGWLYGRCGGSCPGRVGVPGTDEDSRVALEGGIWRYHPATRQFEVLCHGTTNPWGHDWNEFGDGFFINTVNGHLWHLIPGAHFVRPFTLDPNPHVYELIDMHADHWHFETGTKWEDSRDGAANSYGGGHAHCGMMIYLGDNWPDDYRGRLFTWNIHGRRANQELLHRKGSGFVAKHGKDTMLAADTFFRGMELSYGPDGAVYAIDWSDTGECHEHTGVHRTSGRVYRIAYGRDEESKKHNTVDLTAMTNHELVALMNHRNEWFVRQARIELAARAHDAFKEQKAPDLRDVAQHLRKIASGSDAVHAYRALVILHAMGMSDRDQLKQLLAHENENLRAWAIRLLTDHWPIDDVFGPAAVEESQRTQVASECHELIDEFCQLAQTDESGLVRLALASSIQRMPMSMRCKLANELVQRTEDARDHNLPLLVWYGLIHVADDDPMSLADVGVECKWPKTQRLIARRLAEQIDKNKNAVEAILERVAETRDERIRGYLLRGISDGLKGWSKAPKPQNWDQVTSLESIGLVNRAIIRDLSVLFGDGRALDEVKRIVLDEKADIGVRRSALETLVSSTDERVVDICLSVLDDERLNFVAARGLSKSRDSKIASELIKNYKKFRGPQRPKVIEILVSRRQFASELLTAIRDGKIASEDLTAYDVRQIRSLGSAKLNGRVSKLWGEIRDSSEEKRERIESLKKQLTADNLAAANPGQGRLLFNKNCAKCHRLFGYGESTGPDLTGANRNNLDYLLDNVVDPSSVVSKNYRMSIVVLKDDRVLNGLVTAKRDKTITLQTQTDLLTINRDDIAEIRETSMSPMPNGLLDNLADEQIRDLISYLMQPAQVPLSSVTE